MATAPDVSRPPPKPLTARSGSRRASPGARRPPPTRSRAPPPWTAVPPPSGTPSAVHPGKVRNGDTGDIATDHYHRWREDVAMMADLGVSAYRFSLAWPRVQPTGRGPAVQKGLDFYRRLVDELLDTDIQPLRHALPLGPPPGAGGRGRLARARHRRPLRRVRRVLAARRSATGCATWTTLNEPWCSRLPRLRAPASTPRAAPTRSRPCAPRTTSTSATARPSRRCAPRCPPTPRSRITLNLHHVRPLTDTRAGRGRGAPDRRPGQPGLPRPAAARRVPGRPARATPRASPTGPSCSDGDLEVIRQPLDFAGRQLLHADRGPAATGDAGHDADGHGDVRTALAGRRRRRLPARARAHHRHGLAGGRRRACTSCCSGCATTTRRCRW